ncbi:MAG: family 2A encapsulin nanocompartment cargo protein cysteine desulfurase [Myxococcota bacterium]
MELTLPSADVPAAGPAAPRGLPATSLSPVSPFSVTPNFDALFAGVALPFALTASVPLVDAAEPRTPVIASVPFELAPTSHGLPSLGNGVFDPYALRREFPILEQRVNGRRLVWLDNAATTQKPRAVIDRLSRYYETENSNIHRAAHTLAARASDAYESARETARRFLNAPSAKDLVFVRGTTEGINLVAQSWGRRNVEAGDEVVITWLEHHANIVPWQQLCAEKGARLRVAPVDDRGQVILEEYEKLLGPKTKLVAFTQVSNALGTITPAKEMIELAHRHGAKVLLDGAQAVSHLQVDVQQLDCDFFVFSGHKVFAPTGIGVVFGKGPLLAAMPPWQGGGNMIQDVTFERTVFQPPPARFEAGTGNIADAVGLGAALDWLMRVGLQAVSRYEHDLLEYATNALSTVPGLTLYGTAPDKAGVLSFVLAGQKTEELSAVLDRDGIAVRSGHHCAQPILRRLGVEATVRASLAPYNTCEDIDVLVDALKRLQVGR